MLLAVNSRFSVTWFGGAGLGYWPDFTMINKFFLSVLIFFLNISNIRTTYTVGDFINGKPCRLELLDFCYDFYRFCPRNINLSCFFAVPIQVAAEIVRSWTFGPSPLPHPDYLIACSVFQPYDFSPLNFNPGIDQPDATALDVEVPLMPQTSMGWFNDFNAQQHPIVGSHLTKADEAVFKRVADPGERLAPEARGSLSLKYIKNILMEGQEPVIEGPLPLQIVKQVGSQVPKNNFVLVEFVPDKTILVEPVVGQKCPPEPPLVSKAQFEKWLDDLNRGNYTNRRIFLFVELTGRDAAIQFFLKYCRPNVALVSKKIGIKSELLSKLRPFKTDYRVEQIAFIFSRPGNSHLQVLYPFLFKPQLHSQIKSYLKRVCKQIEQWLSNQEGKQT